MQAYQWQNVHHVQVLHVCSFRNTPDVPTAVQFCSHSAEFVITYIAVWLMESVSSSFSKPHNEKLWGLGQMTSAAMGLSHDQSIYQGNAQQGN
jgi:hypothetical protein